IAVSILLRSVPIEHSANRPSWQHNQVAKAVLGRGALADHPCQERQESNCHREPIPQECAIRWVKMVIGRPKRSRSNGKEGYKVCPSFGGSAECRIVFGRLRLDESNPQNADNQKQSVREHIECIRDGPKSPLVRKIVIALILRNRWINKNAY